jgi:nucleotide-binding universal stress UspA family protein
MRQFKKILLCTHPEITSSDIVDYAAEIALHTQGEIKVFHVIGGYPEKLEEWWNVRNPQQLHDEIQKEREQFVAGIVNHLRGKGIKKVSSEVRWGTEAIETTREAIRNRHDLVMTTARDKSEIKKKLTECPSRELYLICPCVLWIAQQGRVSQWTKHIVAALPRVSEPLRPGDLSTKILDYAIAVAQSTESSLYIVHALPKYGEVHAKGVHKHDDDLSEFIDKLRNQCLQYCQPIAENYQLKLTSSQIHLLVGNPNDVIPEFIHEKGADLVVMGAAARGGLSGFLHSSTAEKVLQEVNCSILAVKPDDFVSPVTI